MVTKRQFYIYIINNKCKPFIPMPCRRNTRIFNATYNISHPGIVTTTTIIKDRIVWLNITLQLGQESAFFAKSEKHDATESRFDYITSNDRFVNRFTRWPKPSQLHQLRSAFENYNRPRVIQYKNMQMLSTHHGIPCANQ